MSIKITYLPLYDAERLGCYMHKHFVRQCRGEVGALELWLNEHSCFNLRQASQLMLLATQFGSLLAEGFNPQTVAEALELLELNDPTENYEDFNHIGWDILRTPGLELS